MEGVVIIPLLRGYIRGLATTMEAWPMGEVKDNMGVDGRRVSGWGRQVRFI